MRLLRGYIDWMAKFANEPTLVLSVDRLPDLEMLRYEKRESYYFAEYEGYVRFFSYNRPGNGFGGATYDLTMTDGTTKQLIGPWSGNASTANTLGFPESLEVSIHDRDSMPCSGAVTTAWLLPQLHLINCGISAFNAETRLMRRGHSITPCVGVDTNRGYLKLTKTSDTFL